MFSQTGQVSQVSAKPFTDKWDKQITLYSFQLAGANVWYRTGTIAPPCQQGDTIEFVYEQQGQNCKVTPNSIRNSAAGGQMQAPPAQAIAPQYTQNAPPPAAAPPPHQPYGGAKKATSRDSYWENKDVYDKEVTQPRIAYAAAQKAAIQTVGLALQHDCLGFGSAKKADKLELLTQYVNELTVRFALDLDNAHNILSKAKEITPEAVVANEDDMYA